MKKILLCVSLLSMFAAGFVGCSQKREWNHEQRKAMREALRSYRQMVYLDDLTDAEFVLFTDQVAGELEGTYPVYATFVEMPGVTDTVDMVVVTTIVDELNADARNMRHIFPYNYLVAQGVLPAGLDHDQQKAFYNCFAGKVNDTYDTMSQFFNAILADTTDMSQLRHSLRQGSLADPDFRRFAFGQHQRLGTGADHHPVRPPGGEFLKHPAPGLSFPRHSDRVKRRYTSGTVHEHDVSGRLS